MGRDFKIGMALGLVIAGACGVWFCSRRGTAAKPEQLQNGSGLNVPGAEGYSSAEPDGTRQSTESERSAVSGGGEITTIHYVQKGETLSEIARHYYGSANEWRKIIEANRNVLKDPDKLKAGMRLAIPE